jgi:hypothetical protein
VRYNQGDGISPDTNADQVIASPAGKISNMGDLVKKQILRHVATVIPAER